MNSDSHNTFRILDKALNIPESQPMPDGDFPLPTWYHAVRDIPLQELGIEDFCKACRQQIHLDHIVPLALRTFQSDPFAGDMYDGELVASLGRVPPSYWRSHPDEADILKAGLQWIIRQEADADVQRDANEILGKIGKA